ncbi:hypothetical protein DPMN_174731 [Dreissena polymorpha]|uniref:Uncharacterized protein n=1 Tax=Dreissena polymorpha TaxID=45954 RepID=A0A9D4E809_DREPO|nr:hypothetical protein DPMN_174731 [Dreissena polymorpha]
MRKFEEATSAYSFNCYVNEIAMKMMDEGVQNKKELFNVLKTACEGPNPSLVSCTDLGRMYDIQVSKEVREKINISDNLPRAMRYYERACDGGCAAGCTLMAKHLLNKKEMDRSLEFSQKACEYGNTRSCFFLHGVFSGKSNLMKNVPVDSEKAEYYYRKSVADSRVLIEEEKNNIKA